MSIQPTTDPNHIGTGSADDKEIGPTEHVEIADYNDATRDLDVKPGFWGRFLKKDASPVFLADVGRMNQVELDPQRVKKLERKIDLLILPCLAICYMFYYVDKTTLSYAAIFGIREDLKLKKTEYSWLSSIFYFGWLAWAFPANVLMQKFPLNKYLAANIFLWGVLLMAQAASRNFTDLLVLRFLSGAFEAVADPAFVLITSTWYTRAQQPSRIGVWYCANGFGIAFGGLLGYLIGQIKGGIPSWKWEFIIIGLLCSVWAIVMGIFIPDSPYFTHWFTREERVMIVSRKRHDQHSVDKREWNMSQMWEGFIDIKTYLFFLFGLSANIPNGGTSNFGTLIVKGLGFSTLNTTLMQIPYGLIIVLFIVGAIYLNKILPDGNRTYLMILTTIPTVVGFALIAFTSNKGLRLFGYWITGASNATFVVGLSLVSGNVGGQSKKAVASAAVFLGLAAGNIIGPFAFFESDAPGYRTGVIVCMASRAFEILVILALRVVFVRANRKRDRAVAEGRIAYDATVTALADISDWKNPAFRYVT